MDAINRDDNGILKQTKCFALDLDGTMYLGAQWIDGALDFLDAVTAAGKSFCFMTNNSSKSAAVYQEKLRAMGLDVDPETQLVTSGQATIDYVQRHYAGKRVFLLGNELLKAEFQSGGIVLDDTAPEVVITAFDTSLNYQKLCLLCDFVRVGLPYIATHPDYNCPTETGFIPDIGAIHAFVQASAGRMPDVVVGKPSSLIVDYLLRKTNHTRETTAIVGDRLYTDIAAGVENGLPGVLVLSGETALDDVKASAVQPDLIFDSVRHMIPYL